MRLCEAGISINRFVYGLLCESYRVAHDGRPVRNKRGKTDNFIDCPLGRTMNILGACGSKL